MVGNRGYLFSLLMGLLVTFLWSTSYVLVKIGLRELPPLTFAAYRYVIASSVLLILTFLRGEITRTAKKELVKCVFLGITGYSIAQGFQFVGLYYLPAVSVTFLLNFTPVLVLLLSLVVVKEVPRPSQVLGMVLAILGAYLFFQVPLSGLELRGVVITVFSGFGWATYMVLIREFFRNSRLHAVEITSFSMFFGAVPLLILATLVEGPLTVSPSTWFTILWLSLVNTACAFVLWNHVLKQVGAFELSVLQNTMMIQIGVLACTFLGEELTAIKLVAMSIVIVGVLVVQLTKPK